MDLVGRRGLTQCTKPDTLPPDIIAMSLLLNPPFGESAGALRPGFFFSASGEGDPRYVFDASKMLAMDASSIASNSSSVCCAVSPSVRAREKLATTPWLRAIRALASSRV